MRKFLKLLVVLILLVVAVQVGYKLSEFSYIQKERKERELQKELESRTPKIENVYVYPQEADENRGISISYSEEVLAKKARGERLTGEENALISQFLMQEDGYGIAYTLWFEHGEGMGKTTRRVFETANGGKNWNVLQEYYPGIGPYSCTYMDNIFIEASFNTTSLS